MSRKKAEKIKTGKRAGRGSHGALTKAGRVRDTTPIMEKTSKHRNKGPRREKRSRYKRLLYEKSKIRRY